jgi:Rho termination factor, N-terminal domain
MASLNDTLTLGLILILLFGAVSLYLYTRIQQCEQKLNLVESILLDIKMSAELREYPDLPQMEVKEIPASYRPAPVEEVADLSDSGDESPPTKSSAPVEEFVPTLAPVQEAKPIVQVNYESMTLAELKDLAKQRTIKGASSMKRSQIIEALRTSDRASSEVSTGGILSDLAEVSGPIDVDETLAA